MSNGYTELKNQTIAGIFWRFGERFLAQFVNVLVAIILARVLLPEEYGIVALVSIVINLANILVTNGLGTSLIQKKDADELDFSTMFFAGIGFSLLIYLGLFLIAPLAAREYQNKILIPILRVIGIRLPIAAVNSIQQAYISRKMMFKKFFLATLSGTIVSAIVGICMALNGCGAWALVGQYLTNVVIDTVMLFIRIDWRPKMMFSWERMKTLFTFGWKLMFAGFLGCLCDQLRGLIVGLRYTTSDLSFISQGERIPMFIANNVNATLDSVLFPSISKVQEDIECMRSAVRRMMRVGSFVVMPLMMGLAAISRRVVLVMLGNEWLPCVPFMRIVCVQMCFGVLGTVNLQALKALGRSDIILRLEFIKKPIYLGMIFFTMQISPLAMTIGSAIYGLVAVSINAGPNKRFLKYQLKEQIQDVAANFLISISMGVVVLVAGWLPFASVWVLFIQIVLGILYYVVVSKILHIDSLEYILCYVGKVARRNGNHSKVADRL